MVYACLKKIQTGIAMPTAWRNKEFLVLLYFKLALHGGAAIGLVHNTPGCIPCKTRAPPYGVNQLKSMTPSLLCKWINDKHMPV
ncbi:4a-hydroxytetrahydrobiopterin dehydratase [Neisseria wadsworthii 9715]|uniref:4a-hydroxytetrahydrobiopterin dehydratase n=1 Tax=Neisseria wadsworthii 9715 TaxID=1030841 RepID=G4CNE9_9NEIS|nr:4a-hydroxytetrahydrobiopterin dehydratase [Neisseria wadsworthii 9715]